MKSRRMKKQSLLFGIGMGIGLWGCTANDKAFHWEYADTEYACALLTENDSAHAIRLTTDRPSSDEWDLPYPVYRFDYGDVTGDGLPEVAVGVIKPTRFFPTPDKRLFLYQVTDGIYIRPLWLGSRVGQPLEDFRLVRTEHPSVVRTMEKEKDGTFLVAEYRWKGFGLSFLRYKGKELSRKDAVRLLEE